MVNGRVLVSRLKVSTRFGFFRTGVLSVPTLHDTSGGHLAVKFRGDLSSDRVSFIYVRAATTTSRPARVSDPPAGRVSADHLAHSDPRAHPGKNALSFPTAYLAFDNDNAYL